MEALALRKEAIGVIERMREDDIPLIIKFARFIEQDREKITPISTKRHLQLGFLKGTSKVRFSDDWEMTEEELLSL